MTTMASAIQDFLENSQGKVTSEQIKSAVTKKYPEQWQPATLQAHLYACVVNNPKAYIHHPFAKKFLYKNNDNTFELYSESKHGPNEWSPQEGADDSSEADELIQASIGLERDIEDHLVDNLSIIEPGLKFVSRQHTTDVGRIDILAEDKNGTRVVIELKVGDAKDSSVGQITRYLGWFAKKDKQKTRGILVASGFPEGVKYAASIVPDLQLFSYRVNFSFENSNL